LVDCVDKRPCGRREAEAARRGPPAFERRFSRGTERACCNYSPSYICLRTACHSPGIRTVREFVTRTKVIAPLIYMQVPKLGSRDMQSPIRMLDDRGLALILIGRYD